MRSPIYARILGLGKCVPSRLVTNDDLAKKLETSDEWILSRTGIAERRFVADGESTATLAMSAGREALMTAGVAPQEVDLLIVSTSTPDYVVCPPTACLVQYGLGLSRAGAFDLSATCSGFVYGLVTAAQLISTGSYRRVLVIGAETLSRFVDFEDRTTCVLFGDGAGAALLAASDEPGGLLSFVLGADGSGADYLNVPAGGSRRPPSRKTVAAGQHKIRMNGREVYRFSTTTPAAALAEAASDAGVAVADLDLVIAHQANLRILQTTARNLGVPDALFYTNLDRYGNTSSASVPLALYDAHAERQFCPGSVIGLLGFGGGLTWATAIWQWQGTSRSRSDDRSPVHSQVAEKPKGVRTAMTITDTQGAQASMDRSMVDVIRTRAQLQPEQTIFTFLADGETETGSLTYAQLDQWARAIAVALEETRPGDRVLLTFPPGLDFIKAFFGCLYAGRVAVPTYPPRPRRLDRDWPRLRAVLADSRPSVVLATADIAASLRAAISADSGLRHVEVLPIEEVGVEHAASWRDPRVRSDSLAFLQYTSGSTAAPKGVMVSHGNLMHHLEMLRQVFGFDEHTVGVDWLPPYHDLGLIGNRLAPAYTGSPFVIMPPAAFLQWPARWLRAISRYRATYSAGPNFAYEWCVRKIRAEQCEGLDLSCWEVALNGAEPIRASTLEAFADRFAPYGFSSKAFYPSYGLAEATVFATGVRRGAGATVLDVDVPMLEEGRVAAPTEPRNSRRLVGSGSAWLDRRVVIADPDTATVAPPDTVGEIWLSGPDVAQGYWNQPEETHRTFRAYLADRPDGPYLRTGDLGVVREGELFVTGRLKDLIILDGRNHYPQDLEQTAEQSHPFLRPGSSAGFSIDVEGQERAVLVLELERERSGSRAVGDPDLREITARVRQTVVEQHAIQLHDVVLLRVGMLPRTTSGKVRRAACRAAYLSESLNGVLFRHPWAAPNR